jgi:hypothetical protein
MGAELSPNYDARSDKGSSGNGWSILATLIAPLFAVLLTHYLNDQEKRQTTFKLPIPDIDAGRQEAQHPEPRVELSMSKDSSGDHVGLGQAFPVKSEKQDLAKKLMGGVNETSDNPANRLVSLLSIKDIATRAGDGQTAFRAIDTLAEKFQVDANIMKLTVLAKFASAAQKPAEHKNIAEQALMLADQAIGQDHFIVASQLDKLALAEAKRAPDRELLAQAQDRMAEVAELVKARERRLK